MASTGSIQYFETPSRPRASASSVATTTHSETKAWAYADELAAASVDVFAKNYPGMIHTFASLYAISGGADQALGELLKEFRHRALVPRSTREAARDLHSPRP
jgi:acetyl esterase/lipase